MEEKNKLHAPNWESEELLRELYRSKLFILVWNNEYYLVSGVICKMIEGDKVADARELVDKVGELFRLHKRKRLYKRNLGNFETLYCEFLNQEPLYNEKVNAQARKDIQEMLGPVLENAEAREVVRQQRKEWFKVIELIEEIDVMGSAEAEAPEENKEGIKEDRECELHPIC